MMGLHGCSSNGGNLDDSRFSEPLPWIGVYIAAASLACALAMAADAYIGISHRKLWFPNIYFSLNAASLSLLSIATKLPVDLNTSMPRPQDQLAKLSGTVFLCTVMGNFMPSLGTMEETETLMNIVALCILVITVVVNIGIQMGTGVIYVFIPEHAAIMFLLLVLLAILGFSALTTPTSKRLLEKQFKYKHQELCHTGLHEDGAAIVEKLKHNVKKYWVMAITSSPQYVLGRSAMSTASGAFCLFAALILMEAAVRSLVTGSFWFCSGESDYKWSSTLVLVSQAVGILVGTIAPALRWLNAVCFNNLQEGVGSFRKELRVEKWWILGFLETKEKHLPFGIHKIRSRRIRTVVYITKNQILDVLIAIQTALVLISKSVRLISGLILCSLHSLQRFLFTFFCKGLLSKLAPGGSISRASDSVSSLSDPNIINYVLHLEGEEKLVQLIARNGCTRTDEWIKKARKNKPTNLLDLLRKSTASQDFKGVFEFDSDRVPSIALAEPPNCWALPVATLTAIAVALHSNNKSEIACLLSGVHEGLGYVRLVQKTLDTKGPINVKEAADFVWLEVDVYNRWLGVNLRKFAREGKCSKEVLEELADVGKKHVLEYIQQMGRKKNPHYWPPKVLAANSMYRTSQTILQDYNKFDTDVKLFERLQSMIADIFAACLTNLPHLISTKCLCTAIEVRVQNVAAAVQLLGEAENILLMVGQKARFNLDPNQMAYIDEWRLAKQKSTPSVVSPFDDESMLCFSSEELSLIIE